MNRRQKTIGIIVILVLVIALFVYLRYRRASKYVIPTSATGGDTNDNSFYTAITNAQTAFQNAVGADYLASIDTWTLPTGGSGVVSIKTLEPHRLVTGDRAIIAGVIGAGTANYNSPVNVSNIIPNTSITISGQTVTVTTASPHYLYTGALVNIQGSGGTVWSGTGAGTTFDTAINCSLIPPPTSCISISRSGVTSNIQPAADVSAVSITVPTSSVNTYTYTWPAGRGMTPTGLTGAGNTVVASGLPTSYPITYVDNLNFTYTPPIVPTGTPTSVGYVFSFKFPEVSAAFATKDIATTAAINTFQNAKCPILDPSTWSIITSSSTYNTAYQQYLTDINKLNTAYTGQTVYPGSSTAGNVTQAMYNAALAASRKADVTSVLRKFYYTACTNLYDQTNYPNAASVLSGAVGTSVGSGGAIINTTNITSARILQYAQYCASNPLLEVQPTTGALVSGSTKWTTSTYTDPFTGATSVPGWKIAKNYGVGSVAFPNWT